MDYPLGDKLQMKFDRKDNMITLAVILFFVVTSTFSGIFVLSYSKKIFDISPALGIFSIITAITSFVPLINTILIIRGII